MSEALVDYNPMADQPGEQFSIEPQQHAGLLELVADIEVEAEVTEVSEVATSNEAINVEPYRRSEDTAYSGDLIRQYLNDIGKISLLKHEQVIDLSKWIEAGLYAEQKLQDTEVELTEAERAELEQVSQYGVAAKKQMVEANARLVVSIAKRKIGHGVPLLDLIQEGNIGLIRAVEKYDYSLGYKFSTYATLWIKQAIQRGAPEMERNIRLPSHVAEELSRMERFVRVTQLETGHVPTDQEIMEKMDIDKDRLSTLREIGKRTVSLDIKVGEDETSTIGDIVFEENATTPETQVLVDDATSQLYRLIDELPDEREQFVVKARYGLDGSGKKKTYTQLHEIMGISRERVRQIEVRGIKHIKKIVESRQIEDPRID